MRTEKELLTLLRDELPEMIEACRRLCITIVELQFCDKITYEESLILDTYIKENEPVNQYSLFAPSYWFEPGELNPRIEWLNKEIQKL